MSFIARKLGQTVFPEIAPAAIWLTLVAMGICVGCDVTGYQMNVSTVFLSILSTMLSFVISLRTSSALERWNAGRQAWTLMNLASRNLGSLIWLHVGPTTLTLEEQGKLAANSDEEDVEKVKALIEKRTMLGLIEAYSAATKHYVRGESGIYHDDLYHLVKFLPKYSFPSAIDDADVNKEALSGLWRSPLPDGTTVIPVGATSARREPLSASVGTRSSTMTGDIDLEKGTAASTDDLRVLGKDGKLRKIKLSPGYNPPEKGLMHYAPIFLIFKPLIKLFKSKNKGKRVKVVAATNIPLEIHMFLSGYIAACIKRGQLAAPFVGVAFGYLNQLAEALASQERVLSSPLPFAYDCHLRAVTYVFLIFLPFQIYASLKYLTILAEFIAAVVFLGFLELGSQLEQPFGYDDSDLPLDDYVNLLASELQEIAAHPAPSPATFVWSPSNTPFQPFDKRSAPEILAEFGQSHGGVNQPAVGGVPGMRRFLGKHLHELEERGRKAREAAKKHHRRRSVSWGSQDEGDREVEVTVL